MKLRTATLTLDQAEHNPDCNRPPAPGPDVPGPRGDVHPGGGDGDHAEQVPVPVDETASSSTTIKEADPRCVSFKVNSVPVPVLTHIKIRIQTPRDDLKRAEHCDSKAKPTQDQAEQESKPPDDLRQAEPYDSKTQPIQDQAEQKK